MHHRLLHHLKYLSNATVHVDPLGLAGEEHHRHGPGNTEHGSEHASDTDTDASGHEHEHGHPHSCSPQLINNEV